MGSYETPTEIDRALHEEKIDLTSKARATKSRPAVNIKDRLLSYKLLEDVNNGILFFGKVRTANKKTTAEFICPACDEAFHSVLSPILSGSKKHCGCLSKK